MKALAGLCLVFLLSSCTEQIVPKLISSSAEEAVIDLSNWNFEEDGPIRLMNNTWEFYWERLYTPEDFRTGAVSEEPVLVTGGKAWNGTIIDGEKLDSDGYATYRAVVRLPAGGGIYSIYMQNQDSAYRLWLNGEEVAGNGLVADTEDAYTPQRLPRVSCFNTAGGRLEIVMQAANFTHKWGGLTNNIYLGPSKAIRAFVNRLYGIINFLCGAILIMALYHLILYVINRRDPSALFFALFCFFVFSWYLFNGEYLFYRLFPSFPLAPGIRLFYMSICGVLPFFLLFIRSAYPDKALRIPLRVLIGAGFGMTVIPFITPVKFFSSRLLVPFYALVLIGAVLVFIILIRALFRKHPGALFSLTGFAVFIGTVGYDMLAERKIFTGSAMGPFAPAGLFVFILLHSFILARQFYSAYGRLDDLSRNLERKVGERTAELKKAQEQAHLQEKLAALGTLAGGVSHEILNPLSGISGPLEIIRKELGNAGLGDKTEVVRHLSYIEDNVGRITTAVKTLDALMKDRRIIKTSVPLLPVIRRVTGGYPEAEIGIKIAGGTEVMGDEGVLLQILENLVSNAVESLEAGGRIAVRYEAAPAPGRIILEDTGCGMEQTELSRAFDPFYTTKKTSGGTGLGLFLSRRLAESLGWQISLSSCPGEGTTATIVLS